MSNEIGQFAKTTLFDCPIGRPYRIIECTLDEEVKNRLYEMGLVPHTAVTVNKRAPLRDPLQITVRGYSLCIRGNIAKAFVVEELL